MKTSDRNTAAPSGRAIELEPNRAATGASGRGSTLARLLTACALLALAACGVVPTVPERRAPDLKIVFPQPPDEPRFYYERTLYGSADVVAGEANSALRQLLTGEGPKGSEGMGKPYAVAVHHGRVFVSDSVQRYVTVFDIPGRRFYRIGDDGPGQLVKPLGLDVDQAGNLYVADATTKTVVVFDEEGNFLRKLGGAKWFERLGSVTIDPKGDRLYVVDVGGVRSNEHRIRVFDPVKGTHLFDFGTRGSGPGELNLPYDLAVGKDGRLYVVDTGNFRVQVFDRDGKYLSTFGSIGSQVGSFARPKEIAVGPDGNLYIIDALMGHFQIFDPAGNLLLAVGQRAEQDGPARFMLPSGIHVDGDGRVYVVDQWFRKIDIFRPAKLKADEGYIGVQAPAAAVKK